MGNKYRKKAKMTAKIERDLDHPKQQRYTRRGGFFMPKNFKRPHINDVFKQVNPSYKPWEEQILENKTATYPDRGLTITKKSTPIFD